MDIFREQCYAFHEKDREDRCFLCGANSVQFFVLRHSATMSMVHLCEPCIMNNLSDFYLDNTRPWTAKKDRSR